MSDSSCGIVRIWDVYSSNRKIVINVGVSGLTILVTNEFIVVRCGDSCWRICPTRPQVVGIDGLCDGLRGQRNTQTVMIRHLRVSLSSLSLTISCVRHDILELGVKKYLMSILSSWRADSYTSSPS